MRIVNEGAPFGAEIAGLDPDRLQPSDAPALRALLRRHRFLVFRDLDLTAEQHVAIMSLFNRVIVEVPDATDPARLEGRVSFVTTEPNEYISGRNELGFHSDFSFYDDGAGEALSLYAIRADAEDPTIFADMVAAMDSLPASLLARLRELRVVKCANFFHEPVREGPRYRITQREPAKDYGHTASVRPVIVRHPATGEALVNLCQIFSSHISGWNYAESDGLFAEVESLIYAEKHLARHAWRTGDLLVWDNIALQHGRGPVSAGAVRHLRRVVANSWDVAELQRRNRAAISPRDTRLQPAQ